MTSTRTTGAPFFNAWDQAELERLVDLCINQTGNADGPPCRGADPVVRNAYFPNAAEPDGGDPDPDPDPKPEPDPDPEPDPSPSAYDHVVKSDSPAWYARRRSSALTGATRSCCPT
jgi:hypothetical protein